MDKEGQHDKERKRGSPRKTREKSLADILKEKKKTLRGMRQERQCETAKSGQICRLFKQKYNVCNNLEFWQGFEYEVWPKSQVSRGEICRLF